MHTNKFKKLFGIYLMTNLLLLTGCQGEDFSMQYSIESATQTAYVLKKNADDSEFATPFATPFIYLMSVEKSIIRYQINRLKGISRLNRGEVPQCSCLRFRDGLQ